MCSCNGGEPKAVYTSAQAKADLEAKTKQALVDAANNASSLANAQANAGGR